MKKIIPALAMLLISAIVMSTASFAWFSMNETVDAQGMEVKAKASGALIVNETNTLDEFVGKTSVIFSKAKPATLSPATYASSKWQYNAHSEDAKIDANTGLGGTATDITKSEQDQAYFIDYTCYIASSGAALTGKNLVAKVDWAKITNSLPTGEAVSVAFYVQPVNVKAPVGNTDTGATAFLYGQLDVNPTGLVPTIAQQHGTNANTEQEWVIYENKTIPSATEDGDAKGVLAVTMRVYFDGALTTDDGSKCYIRSADVDDSSFALAVTFTAETYQAPATPDAP